MHSAGLLLMWPPGLPDVASRPPGLGGQWGVSAPSAGCAPPPGALLHRLLLLPPGPPPSMPLA
eukprot:5861353-Pyramimonas_sp.AAC.1